MATMRAYGLDQLALAPSSFHDADDGSSDTQSNHHHGVAAGSGNADQKPPPHHQKAFRPAWLRDANLPTAAAAAQAWMRAIDSTPSIAQYAQSSFNFIENTHTHTHTHTHTQIRRRRCSDMSSYARAINSTPHNSAMCSIIRRLYRKQKTKHSENSG